jgi:hypothetical protein
LVPAADTLYHNNGDGTFTDVTQKAGMAVRPSYGLGAVWGDYDNDGDLDLFVANDSMPNFLFQNQGNGSFREVGLLSGAALSEEGKEQAGMGVAMGDYDHDGQFDLYVTHFSDDYGTLYRNLGRGVFRDVSYSANVAFPSWRFLGWGTDFCDYDNDGWEDLFVAAGHIYPQLDRYRMDISYYQRKLLFRNLGNGKFEEIAEQLGQDLLRPWSSRGAAFADFDNDGDVDIAVNNLDAGPSLFCNEGGNKSGHWLVLDLEGTGKTNRSAIGTRVTIETEAGRQMQEVRGGSSYQATNDLRLHFGLGKAERVVSASVRWTDGAIQKFRDLGVDRSYRLVKGKEPVNSHPEAVKKFETGPRRGQDSRGAPWDKEVREVRPASGLTSSLSQLLL